MWRALYRSTVNFQARKHVRKEVYFWTVEVKILIQYIWQKYSRNISLSRVVFFFVESKKNGSTLLACQITGIKYSHLISGYPLSSRLLGSPYFFRIVSVTVILSHFIASTAAFWKAVMSEQQRVCICVFVLFLLPTTAVYSVVFQQTTFLAFAGHGTPAPILAPGLAPSDTDNATWYVIFHGLFVILFLCAISNCTFNVCLISVRGIFSLRGNKDIYIWIRIMIAS